MTTVASIITSAFRESNILPLGVAPTTAQSAEAFNLLSTVVSSALGNSAGENLNPFPLGQNNIENPSGYPWWSNEIPGGVFLPTNMRVMCNLTAAGTINLHPKPHDGARMGIVDVSGNFATNPLTVNGNGRNIEGASTQTYSTNGQVRQWVYREDLGNWVVVDPLSAVGDMPWPSEFDDLFIILLAMRLNPRYGTTMAQETMEMLRATRSRFSARYSQSTTQMPSEDALLYLTNQYRYYGGTYGSQWGDSTGQFNSGYPYG